MGMFKVMQDFGHQPYYTITYPTSLIILIIKVRTSTQQGIEKSHASTRKIQCTPYRHNTSPFKLSP